MNQNLLLIRDRLLGYKMNCIDVHRKLTAAPDCKDEAILSHLEECSACANFLNSIQQFDQSLIKAAKIEIPDGLADRILLKQSFRQQHQMRANRFKLFALAASLLLVLSVSFNMSSLINILDKSLSLEEIALNHVIDEIDHLNENKNIQLAKLNTVLQPFNIKMKNTIGQINYASTCPIRNSRGVHIILQQKNELATLLVMPGEYVASRKMHTKGDFTTVVFPTQNGSIAIVTKKGSKSVSVENLEKDLSKAIQYI